MLSDFLTLDISCFVHCMTESKLIWCFEKVILELLLCSKDHRAMGRLSVPHVI